MYLLPGKHNRASDDDVRDRNREKKTQLDEQQQDPVIVPATSQPKPKIKTMRFRSSRRSSLSGDLVLFVMRGHLVDLAPATNQRCAHVVHSVGLVMELACSSRVEQLGRSATVGGRKRLVEVREDVGRWRGGVVGHDLGKLASDR
jgi:hypothetical protein